MIGDGPDMAARLKSVLPVGWFSDSSPMLGGLLLGLGQGWSAVYGLIQFVQLQTRVATATGGFLDLISTDFFGAWLPRRSREQDQSFGKRIRQELLRPRATRSALQLALTELTGRAPVIFEPARTSDTGGYTAGGVAWGGAGVTGQGGWGSLLLPYQIFVTAYRPAGGGIALLAGYGTGGLAAYGDLEMLTTLVSDSDIASAVTRILPAATIAWMRLSA